MVKVLERCFIDENKDNEYFSKYLKLSWNFANKYTELNKLKRDFEFKKNNIITYEFNKLYYNNYNYNSSLLISNNIANRVLNNEFQVLLDKEKKLIGIETNYINYRNLCYNV